MVDNEMTDEAACGMFYGNAHESRSCAHLTKYSNFQASVNCTLRFIHRHFQITAKCQCLTKSKKQRDTLKKLRHFVQFWNELSSFDSSVSVFSVSASAISALVQFVWNQNLEFGIQWSGLDRLNVKDYTFQLAGTLFDLEAMGDTEYRGENCGHTDPQIYVAELRERIGLSSVETKISSTLTDSMTALIWDMKYITAEPTFFKRLLNDLNIFLMNGDLELEPEKVNPNSVTESNNNEDDNKTTDQPKARPSDIRDLLEYKPTEIVADKATQILALLCLGKIESCFQEMDTLKHMLEQQCIKLHDDNYIAFSFIGRTLECFANLVTGRQDQHIFHSSQLTDAGADGDGETIPKFETLPSNSRTAVTVAKCLLGRHLRHNSVERLEVMKKATIDDPTNFEWFLTAAEMSRKKRRDSNVYIGAKKSIQEEYYMVAEALLLAPENPFVQMGVLDCIIDCLRDTKGEFKCGDLAFESADEAAQHLRTTSKKLLANFPNSVKLHSLISDYFCRLLPFRYFDIPFAERSLDRAYELNPMNPKTTHRLGIFTRMSKGDIETSYKWFQKTCELSPMHFNARMECIKNKLARPKEEQVIKYMDDLITTPAVSCWTEHEMLELLFYKGLAHFAENDKEKALEIWNIVAEKNDNWFRLNDLDRTCGFYYWNDKQISSDQLRLWINDEKKSIEKLMKSGNCQTNDQNGGISVKGEEREKLVELLFSLMIAGGYPSRPCRNSGPFHPSPTYQLVRAKYHAQD